MTTTSRRTSSELMTHPVGRHAAPPGGYALHTPLQEEPVNTRTIATLALVIAALLLLFLVVLPRL